MQANRTLRNLTAAILLALSLGLGNGAQTVTVETVLPPTTHSVTA